MPDTPKTGKIRFWLLLGLILAVDIVLTFLYTLIVPGLSASGWGDALCVSAVVLAIGCVVPVFLDASRGFGMAGKVGGSKAEQRDAFQHERELREKGMQITFVLALATVLIGLLSLILSLL
jgi:hypothetical protein